MAIGGRLRATFGPKVWSLPRFGLQANLDQAADGFGTRALIPNCPSVYRRYERWWQSRCNGRITTRLQDRLDRAIGACADIECSARHRGVLSSQPVCHRAVTQRSSSRNKNRAPSSGRDARGCTGAAALTARESWADVCSRPIRRVENPPRRTSFCAGRCSTKSSSTAALPRSGAVARGRVLAISGLQPGPGQKPAFDDALARCPDRRIDREHGFDLMIFVPSWGTIWWTASERTKNDK